MQDRDLATMSLNDWMTMDDWEWEHALEQVTAEMYLSQAIMRANSESYHAYMEASREFARLKDIGTKIQSLLRAKKA